MNAIRKSTTLQQTRRFLAQRLGIEEGELRLELTLAELGFDPPAQRQLLFDAEHVFGIRFSKDLGPIVTLEDFLSAVAWEVAQHYAQIVKNR